MFQISVNNIYKNIQTDLSNISILDGISLNISEGEKVGIIGPSGSGKTTLLGLMAGLELPTQGFVQLFNKNLSELDENQRSLLRKQQVGFIFQNFQLLDELTAIENVMVPMELANLKNTRIRSKELLEQVGLGNRINHFPYQLSGGEQQRVAIARAFSCMPKVLFADEPTGSIDTKTGHNIIDLLFNLNQEHKTTLVIVTHDNSIALKCDTKYEIDAGKIINV